MRAEHDESPTPRQHPVLPRRAGSRIPLHADETVSHRRPTSEDPLK
jgi:hypothetical protein